VGRRNDGEGRLARCEDIRQETEYPEAGASRSSKVMCAVLSCRWRGIRTIQFLLGHVSVQTTERYLGCKQRFREAVNDRIGIEPTV
jgi:hypothetical protein